MARVTRVAAPRSQAAARLTASTDGTSGGTNQAELYSTQKRFLDGTYASRIRFTDTPASGTDGDHFMHLPATPHPQNPVECVGRGVEQCQHAVAASNGVVQ